MTKERTLELEALLLGAVQVLRKLPIRRHKRLLRQRIAGRLYLLNELVVSTISWGLRLRPELFLDIPDAFELGSRLEQRQKQVGIWIALRDLFRSFAEACQDEAIQEQAAAATEADEVVERVIAGLQKEVELSPLNQARYGTMFMGLVWRREVRKNGGRHGHKKRKPKASSGKTKKKLLSDQARRQERREELQELFEAWTRRG